MHGIGKSLIEYAEILLNNYMLHTAAYKWTKKEGEDGEEGDSTIPPGITLNLVTGIAPSITTPLPDLSTLPTITNGTRADSA